MRIRDATTDDTEALAGLCCQLGHLAGGGDVAHRLRDIALHDAGAVLVAVDKHDVVCGFAHALPQHFVIVEPFAELAGLVVGEGSRGIGVGKALLAAVEAWSCEHGYASVRVRSNVIRDRAHRFYLREGYTEEKRQAVFIEPMQAGPLLPHDGGCASRYP